MTSTGGGPEKTILNSPQFLNSLGFDSACAFFRPPGDPGFDMLRRRAAELNAPIIEIDDRSKLDIRAIWKAIRLCRQRRVAIWHAHDYKSNLIGLIARRFHPMKLVTTAHGWDKFTSVMPLYYRWDKRWWMPRYDKVICVSQNVLEESVAGGVPAQRCVMIENAIDLDAYRRRRDTAAAKQEEQGGAASQLLIGSIGRLSAEKGYGDLIEAFVRVVRQGIDARLVIAGDGDERANLERLIAQSTMSGRIKLIGFCTDTRAFLESLDMFVLSSHREGLPNVVLEAMAVGVPVIATRVGGVPRLLEDGVSGKLIDAGDLAGLAEAIVELAQSPLHREAFARAALQHVTQHWSFQRRMEKLCDLYQEILGQKAVPPGL